MKTRWNQIPVEVIELICQFILPLDGIVKDYQVEHFTSKLIEFPYYDQLKSFSPFDCSSQQFLYLFIECTQYDCMFQTFIKFFNQWFSHPVLDLDFLIINLQMGDKYTHWMRHDEIQMIERIYSLIGISLTCSNCYQHFRSQTIMNSNFWYMAYSLSYGYLFFDRYHICNSQSSSRPISELVHKKCKEKLEELTTPNDS